MFFFVFVFNFMFFFCKELLRNLGVWIAQIYRIEKESGMTYCIVFIVRT